MLIFLSPAKSLDYRTPAQVATHTLPAFLKQSETLIRQLRKLSPAEIAALMGISDPLALLNFHRFADWSLPFTPENAKQAMLAFDGDVYDGLAAKTLSAAGLDFAQRHVRILSGLYGILRPLDLMQPYRLEMGARFVNAAGKDLYAFWGETLLDAINGELAGMPRPVGGQPRFRGVFQGRRRQKDPGPGDPARVRGLEVRPLPGHRLLRQARARADDALRSV
jgi:cytoplasmic iron level regulating protein YaaA (DUF328/UPF0246 family)